MFGFKPRNMPFGKSLLVGALLSLGICAVAQAQACNAVTWADGTYYTKGTIVRYAPNGQYYKLIRTGSNGSDATDPTISYWYWEPTRCGTAPTATQMRGMWMWSPDGDASDPDNSRDYWGNPSLHRQFIAMAKAAGVTDVFIYVSGPNDYRKARKGIQAFNTSLNNAGIRPWALDGCRCYFSDAQGPQALYDNIDAMIAYNDSVPVAARFVGFHADQEPQDDEKYRAFHSDKGNSELNDSGGGVWAETEKDDRERLMYDWVDTFKNMRAKLNSRSLLLSGAFPSWTEDYDGPVTVSYQGVRDNVSHFLMKYVHDYVVMSYNTDPANATWRVETQVAYASTFPSGSRPRVSAALETNPGEGKNITYADTPGKQSKRVVLKDIETIRSYLNKYSAFGGVSIHAAEGWRLLPD